MSLEAKERIKQNQRFKDNWLDLSRTFLNEIPNEVFECIWLESLDISENGITNIEGIERLINLEELHLINTNVTEIEVLAKMPKLKRLNLQNINIQDITPLVSLIRRGLNVVWKSDIYIQQNEIRLFNNPLIHPPLEIVQLGNDAILNYFESLKEGEETVYEAKLLIIGEAGVGKTTFARKICNPYSEMPDQILDTTTGVIVKREVIQENGKPDFLMHIWDFGGQEIYYSTHQFFLSKRSLYVLILDGRIEENPNYWLQVQDLLGENSPVLILVNSKGRIRQNVGIQELSYYYPNLRKPLFTINLKEDLEEISSFRETINYHIRNLPHFKQGEKVPVKWVKIRRKLEELGQKVNYISLERFRSICKAEGISQIKKQDFLSDFFHSLGAILHFSSVPILRKMVILNHEWATGAVYKVLDHTSKKSGEPGHFYKSELEKVWSDLSYQDVYDELLTLMEKFELCYKLPEVDEFIVPQLMRDDYPNYKWDEKSQLQLYYRYTFMPKGIITRLIVRLNNIIEDQKSVWKRGARFTLRNTIAEVKENRKDEEIQIKIKGSDSKELLGIIMAEIDKINSTFNFGSRLKVETMLPCNCKICAPSQKPHYFNYSTILSAREKGRHTIECKNSFLQISISRLLEEVFESLEAHKEDLKKLLISGRLEDFFDKLEIIELEKSVRKRFNILQMRYNNLNDSKIEGTSSTESIGIESIRIKKELLNLID